MGHDFRGCYDLRRERLVLMDRSARAVVSEGETVDGLDDPRVDDLLSERAATRLRDEVAMARELCPAFDLDS
jgi:peptide chain release factor 3